MRVLQLCIKPPYPPNEGGSLAMYAITRSLLGAGHQIKVIAISSFKNPVEWNKIPQDFIDQTRFESVHLDLKIKPQGILKSLFSRESYHVKRFISKELQCKIEEVLKKESYDIIHLESLFFTPYIPAIRKLTNAPVVLRSHNIEHRIWERSAMMTKNPAKRFILRHLASTLKNYELLHLNDYQGILAITPADAEFFRSQECKVPIIDLPFGVEIQNYNTASAYEQNSVGFIGALNWIPNLEGIEWFLKEVWPGVIQKQANARFRIAGRTTPDWLQNTRMQGLEIVGEVESASDFISKNRIFVAPLLSGSGIRVKIIEALALGKAVITTKVGAEGIKYTNEKNILIAHDANHYIQLIVDCLNNPALCKKIGNEGRHLVETEYNNQQLSYKLIAFYNQILNQTP